MVIPRLNPQPSSSASTEAMFVPATLVALVSVASIFCQLTPPAIETVSLTLKAIEGLIFIVLTSDLIAVSCPRQGKSYSVFRPNGALSATPKLILGLMAHVKKPAGMSVRSPPSPPSPAGEGGEANAPVEP